MFPQSKPIIAECTWIFSLDIRGNKIVWGQPMYLRSRSWEWGNNFLIWVLFLVLKPINSTTGIINSTLFRSICGFMISTESWEERSQDEGKNKWKQTFGESRTTQLSNTGNSNMFNRVYMSESMCMCINMSVKEMDSYIFASKGVF